MSLNIIKFNGFEAPEILEIRETRGETKNRNMPESCIVWISFSSELFERQVQPRKFENFL